MKQKLHLLPKRKISVRLRDAIKGVRIDPIELMKSFQILWKPGDEDLSKRFDDATVFGIKPESNPIVDNMIDTMNMAVGANVARRAKSYYKDRGISMDAPLVKFVEKLDHLPTAEDLRKIASLAIETDMNYAETNSIKVQMAVYPFLAMINDSFEVAQSNIMKIYNEDITPETKKMRAAIADYCGDYSGAMNDVFIKNMDDDEFLYKKIESMDKAFLKFGVKLPANTNVYRTMSISTKLANISLDNKKFYFSNYVSTSLKPFMFGMPMADGYSLDVTADEYEKPNLTHNVFGFAITSVDMPVLIPGPLSSFASECEVILPRGTVVEFEKTYRGPDSQDGHIGRWWVEGKATNIKSLSEMDESEELYDGDHLMETGEVRVLEGFAGFADSLRPAAPKYNGGELLAGAINLENVPFKYIQA
ncbi:ADP-ribosyltransferase [Aeromonas phage Asfd_1]|nr:ADP-ribosyltransferase [Aeromonas phage Asfd_1]